MYGNISSRLKENGPYRHNLIIVVNKIEVARIPSEHAGLITK